MVELTLPKNSQIKAGKTWPKPEGATNLREYKIYRWSPDDDENRRFGYRPAHTEPLAGEADGGISLAKIAPKARVY